MNERAAQAETEQILFILDRSLLELFRSKEKRETWRCVGNAFSWCLSAEGEEYWYEISYFSRCVRRAIKDRRDIRPIIAEYRRWRDE